MAGVRPVLAGLVLSFGAFSAQQASAVTIFTDQAAFTAALGSFGTDNFADFAAGDYFETTAPRPNFSASSAAEAKNSSLSFGGGYSQSSGWNANVTFTKKW
jgi:hypothetical protein